MKSIHVECLPDEALVKKLGFTRKMVTHHSGKSRVFQKLGKVSNHLAMVDEDDPLGPKSNYERNLIRESEAHGIVLFRDNEGNRIFQLKVKLENWIIEQCKVSGTSPRDFGLPVAANEMHDVVNQRISSFEKLIDDLLTKNNPGILYLKKSLSS